MDKQKLLLNLSWKRKIGGPKFVQKVQRFIDAFHPFIKPIHPWEKKNCKPKGNVPFKQKYWISNSGATIEGSTIFQRNKIYV